MSNVERSRSTRYRRERSFSMSSLSSGSLKEYRAASFRRHSKSVRDRRHNSRENSNERNITRDKQPKRQKCNDHRSEKYQIDKFRESPEEESYLRPMTSHSLHKEHDIRTNNSSEKREGLEDYKLDPSMRNFHSTTYPIEHSITTIQEEPVRSEERRKVRDDAESRLERLEKLVELLVSNKSKGQPNHTNTPQENYFCLNKDKFELVPRDTKFTTSMWLNKIHEECIERNFDEKTSIQFLENNMTGIIKAWYKTIPSYDFTWPELKMLITKTFPDNADFASTLKLLVERKKKLEESVTQYYFCKMYLIEACKISGVDAVSCIIDGLENEYFRQEAKNNNFLTPEALYSQFLLTFTGYHNNQDILEISEYEQVYSTKPDNPENKQDDGKYRKDKKIVKKCFTCGKFGHITADCRYDPYCYNCKIEGHIASNCPLNYRF